MDLTLELLSIQNPWWRGGSLKFDPVLRQLDAQKLKWRPEIFDKIDLNKDKIYCLTGSRGAGKTTFLKLLIRRLLEENKVGPKQIFYYSCQNLDSFEQLNEMIKLFLNTVSKRQRAYILIDEISNLKNWSKGLEHLKRAGKFKNVTIVIASSYLEKEKNGGLTGECLRIKSSSFSAFVKLLNPNFYEKIRPGNYDDWGEKINFYLDAYLLTGGFPAAVADFFEQGTVSQGIYGDYLYWFQTQVARLGRDIGLTRQILEKIILDLGRPMGYQTLVQKTKARTHLTAAEYLNLLESLFAVKTVYQSEAGRPATRLAKKIYFTDPFLFWLFYAYAHGALDYWRLAREHLHDKNVFSRLLENAVLSHLDKQTAKEISYLKLGVREINFLVRQGKNVSPILIKYGQEVREADFNIFKQAGLKKGVIITKDKLENTRGVKLMPLAYFLLFE